MAIATMTEHKNMWDVDKPGVAPEREGLTAKEITELLKVAPAAMPLLGTWNNIDPTTGGLVKLVLGWVGGALNVHAFGACQPTPCDWGVVKGITYAVNVASDRAIAFSAVYKFGFKETILVGHLLRGQMFIETFNHFTDGSNRFDYYGDEILRR